MGGGTSKAGGGMKMPSARSGCPVRKRVPNKTASTAKKHLIFHLF
jgi:hypothetical protein